MQPMLFSLKCRPVHCGGYISTGAQCLIFVIDSNDRDRFDDARNELLLMLQEVYQPLFFSLNVLGFLCSSYLHVYGGFSYYQSSCYFLVLL